MKTIFRVESCPGAVRCSVLVVFVLSLPQTSLPLEEALLPPKFPDLLSSFAESLSASESLQLLVNSLTEDNELCGCSEVANVNWTEFNANLGLYMFSDAPLRCASPKTGKTHEPNVAAVSGGQTDQTRPLVIGLSVTALVILAVVIFFVTVKKGQYIHTAWDAVKRRSVNLQRQRSDCQAALPSKRHPNVVSVSDSITYSDADLVSKIGCFNFPGKVKTILLPMKIRKDGDGSKPQDAVLVCSPNQSNTNGSGKNSETSNKGRSFSISEVLVGLPQSFVSKDTKLGCKEEIADTEFSDGKTSYEAASSWQKSLRPSVDSSVSAGNAAWSVLPNGRQFIRGRENLVDQNNVHLFSYVQPLSKVKNTKL